MRWLMRYGIAAALLCAPGLDAAAQDARLKAGAQIRFRLNPSDTLHVGLLSRVTRDSLIFRRCRACTRLDYSRADLRELAIFQPYHRADRTLAGLGLGALIGVGLGYLSAESCHGGDQCDLAALAVPFGGIAGAILGAATGFLTAFRWEPVSG